MTPTGEKIYSALLQHIADWHSAEHCRPLILFVPNNLLKSLALRSLNLVSESDSLVWTIPEFLRSITELGNPHPLSLVARLFRIHQEKISYEEDFARFIPWGLRLLSDFDEIDRYMLDPRLVFFNLEQYHQLELLGGELPENIIHILRRFWQDFQYKRELRGRGRFLEYWKHLTDIYQALRDNTLKEKEAWDGLAMRLAMDTPDKWLAQLKNHTAVFAGFSHVCKAEEAFMELVRKHQATLFFYDVDASYINVSENQLAEAGDSVRRLMKTFPPANSPERLLERPKKIFVKGYAGKEAMISSVVDRLRNGDKPVIVVTPSLETTERLKEVLPPLAGYYMGETDYGKVFDIYGFCALLTELHDSYHNNNKLVPLGHLMKTLSHTVLKDYCDRGRGLEEKLLGILKEERVNYPFLEPNKLIELCPELNALISDIRDPQVVNYLMSVFSSLSPKTELQDVLEQLTRFLKSLPELKTDYGSSNAVLNILRTWLHLHPPVSPEPTDIPKAFVIGLLDSRGLDAAEVYVTDFNDGIFPITEQPVSVIPYTLRRAFGLPLMEERMAEQLYLFFRLIQRADSVHLPYNTQPTDTSSGQCSLLIKQLKAEWPSMKFDENVFQTGPLIADASEITVEKTPRILDKIQSYLFNSEGLSATALNTYLNCPLKFYFRYVAGLREPERVGEWTKASFGLLFHKVMEDLYIPYQGVWIDNRVLESLMSVLPPTVQKNIALLETGTRDETYTIKGKNILLNHSLIRAAEAVVGADMQRSPFMPMGLEKNLCSSLALNERMVKFQGKADRIDRTQDGTLLIVDYKTGAESWKGFDDTFLEDIFDSKKHSGYNIQILFYAWLLERENHESRPIKAVVMDVRSLLTSDRFQNFIRETHDLRDHFSDWEKQLTKLVEQILAPEIPFTQTTDTQVCNYCPFKKICLK